ncbi:unnamed protein product, partial [Amoebophrya sp. A25]
PTVVTKREQSNEQNAWSTSGSGWISGEAVSLLLEGQNSFLLGSKNRVQHQEHHEQQEMKPYYPLHGGGAPIMFDLTDARAEYHQESCSSEASAGEEQVEVVDLLAEKS